MRFVCAAWMVLFASSAGAAEDFRVMKLEQDMRNLERQVQSLQRQLSETRQQLRRSDPALDLPSTEGASSLDSERQWLSASAWSRLKAGMSELQVIEILGKPTALRPDSQGRRALLYTLELGSTGFLTGAISFHDGKAVEIQQPELK